MRLYLRLAWRNIWRHRRRTLIIVLAMGLGLSLMMMYDGMVAGFNQAIRLLCALPRGAPVLIAINDLDADGRDVSWLWDARVEDLAGTAHRFGTAGIRAFDMGLRLKYAGLEAWSETDIAAALQRFIDQVPEGETGYLVPTYTAMLRFLDRLLPGTSKREAWS